MEQWDRSRRNLRNIVAGTLHDAERVLLKNPSERLPTPNLSPTGHQTITRHSHCNTSPYHSEPHFHNGSLLTKYAMDGDKVPRRTYLEALLATGTVTGLAGCSSQSDESNSTTSSDPNPQTERSTTTAQRSDLQVETAVPDTVPVGETLEVEVQLSNDGGQSASPELELRANNQVIVTETVTVASNDSQTLTLSSPIPRAPRDEQLELQLGDSAIGTVRVPFPSEVDGVPVLDRPTERRAGATYVNPKYRLDRSRDILNEGAHVLEELGTRVFKGGLYRVDTEYPFAEWPDFDSVVEVVEHPHFVELFERDFDTYVFEMFAFTDALRRGGAGYFYYDEFTEEQAAAETESFYKLTKHLLETYDGTGMEVVLQNWEGDWLAVGGPGNEGPPEPDVLDRMKRWFNARQRGISRARREVESDVAVLGACEINKVRDPIETDAKWIVNTILSDLDVDLVSYSAWDLARHVTSEPRMTEELRKDVHQTLDYIAEHAPPTSAYAARALGSQTPQIYLGEYGMALNRNGIDTAMRAIRTVDEEARDWGVPYTLFWAAYDNGVVIDGEQVVIDPDIESVLREEFPDGVTRKDVYGYYLRYPNGARTPAWYHLAEAFDKHQSEFYRLDFEFDRTISSAELDPDIERGEGRELTFTCYEIDVETTQDSTTLNVGTPGEEGAFARGVFPPEETADGTFRWFGRPAAHTRLYLHRNELDLQGPIEQLHLRGSGADDNLGARVFLDGQSVETLTLNTDSREYSVQLDETT
jgi:hypothetical protein